MTATHAALIALGYPDAAIPGNPTPDQAAAIAEIIRTGQTYEARRAELRAAWISFFKALGEYQQDAKQKAMQYRGGRQ